VARISCVNEAFIWNLPGAVCCLSLQHWTLSCPKALFFHKRRGKREYFILSSPKFTFLDILKLNANEILWIIMASAALTLLFDYPFGNIKKLIFDSKRLDTSEKKKD
jgi:hypothetical protein